MGIINKTIGKVFGKRIKAEATEMASQGIEQGMQQIKAQLGYGRYGGVSVNGRSGGSKWPYGLLASGASFILNHQTLRTNARSAYHDTPQVKALVDRYADTVADVGLMLEPTPKANLLGISEEQAEEWALRVSDSFDSWAKAKKQHRAGTLNFYQSHRLYQIFQHRDGDIFTRLYYSQDKNLLNPLQFGFIDPDQIRGDAFTASWGPCCGDDGIERDSQGREKNYKIWIQKPNKPGDFDFVKIPARGEKSKRIFMLHGFAPEYAGQTRGYSRLSHALQEFEKITDFTLAQIMKAIAQSNLVLYVKPSKDAPASKPFEGMSDGKAGPLPSTQFGTNPTPTDNARNVSFSPLPEATLNTPGSTIISNLEGGEELASISNTAPSESFDRFINAFCSYLSASMSMPLEVLLMKFNQNYSASRGALILFWRVAQIWREEMASDYLNPTYEMWLSGEIAAGRIVAPGWSDPRLRAAWLDAKWIGSPMPNIDPAKTAKADQMYVELGSQTLERVARNLNGSSSRSNRTKLQRENKNLPIPPWSKAFGKGNNK